ncbi:MAG TPA: hypothetical protein VNZ68_03315 [Rhodocyclaceae bacterium]|nr:hypothetical protein [Rhodocyclaceae bacterium]
MSTHDRSDASSAPQPAGGPAAGRRKLLRLGAGMAPAVLMAFASRSAFACHSTTPSAFGSVCTSRPDLLQASNGRGPDYWKTNTGSRWPAPYYSHDICQKSKSKGYGGDDDDDDDDDDDEGGSSKSCKKGSVAIPATTFKSVFGHVGPFTDSTTLLDVLKSNGGGSKSVARAIVAALLNAQSGRTPINILSSSDVIGIWQQYITLGYFEPVGGVRWYASTPSLPYVPGANPGGSGGIIGYLNTTWT